MACNPRLKGRRGWVPVMENGMVCWGLAGLRRVDAQRAWQNWYRNAEVGDARIVRCRLEPNDGNSARSISRRLKKAMYMLGPKGFREYVQEMIQELEKACQ